jgi:peptide subunit release factor 1 (eRF1)
MKACSNCGHENLDQALRCDECGWAMPPIHRCARLGKLLKRAAGVGMIVLVVFQFVSCAVIKANGGGGEYGIYGAVFEFYSTRTFLVAMGFGAALFWAGDYLKRNY